MRLAFINLLPLLYILMFIIIGFSLVARLTTLVNTTNQQVKETMECDEGKVDK